MLEFVVGLRENISSLLASAFLVSTLGKSNVFFFLYGGGLFLTGIPRYKDMRGGGRTLRFIRGTGVVVAGRGSTLGYVGLEVGA